MTTQSQKLWHGIVDLYRCAVDVCQLSFVIDLFFKYVFFETMMVLPKGALLEHCDCFDLLRQMICLLTQSDELTEAVYHKISTIVDEHAHLFRKLYPDAIKTQFHHLVHTPTDL